MVVKFDEFLIYKMNELSIFKKSTILDKIDNLMDNMKIIYEQILNYTEEYNDFNWNVYSDFRMIYHDILNIISNIDENEKIKLIRLQLTDMNNHINDVKKRIIYLKK